MLNRAFGCTRVGYKMEQLEVGEMVTRDSPTIHRLSTEHFAKWFRRTTPHADEHPEQPPISSPLASWKDLSEDWPSFQRRYDHLGIPSQLLSWLWRALQPRFPSAGFARILSTVPSRAEFEAAIKMTKSGSAPGMSGLSYSMIKEWPDHILEAVYAALSALWHDKATPSYWTWRWLVPIPKTTTPTLEDLRPLALVEALRKIWFSVTIGRIQSHWASSGLRQEQHGFRRGRSTDGPILEMVNALETTRDFSADLFVGSWDWRRAFDSVPKQLLVWGWIRLGVPCEIAEYMVAQDLDGITVIRSPFATAAYAAGGRESLERNGLGFVAERGAGQGDVTSPSNWNAIYDILLTALHNYSAAEDEFYTSDIRGIVREASRTAFADDLFSLSGTLRGFQRDADVVSAFAIFTTMMISPSKLRASWVRHSRAQLQGGSSFLIHGAGWVPVEVQFTDYPFKHLGVVQSPSGLDSDQYDAVLRRLDTACVRLAYLDLTPEAKWECLYKKIYPQVLYSMRFMAWRLEKYHSLDRIVSRFLRRITNNMPGFPDSLLYLPRAHLGMGFKRLSDIAHHRKLTLLRKMEWGDHHHRHIASSLLGRALRGIGVYSSQGREVLLRSDSRYDLLSETWWVTSLLEWLSFNKMALRVNGDPWDPGRRPLFLSPDVDVLLVDRLNYQHLISSNVSTGAELHCLTGFQGGQFPEEFRPHVQPHGCVDVRPGQFWIARGPMGRAENGVVCEIIGFDSDSPHRAITVSAVSPATTPTWRGNSWRQSGDWGPGLTQFQSRGGNRRLDFLPRSFW